MRFENLAFSVSLDLVLDVEATPLSLLRFRFFVSGSPELLRTGGG